MSAVGTGGTGFSALTPPTSTWASAAIVMAIVIASSVLAALHDATPAWFEVLAAGALGHTLTASGVQLAHVLRPPTPPTTTSPALPPPPGAPGAVS